MRSTAIRLLVTLPLSLVVLWAGTLASADEFDDRVRQYRDALKRPSLNKRCLGRERLAKTGDLRALEILVRDYSRPEDPKDMVRSWLVMTLTEEFGDEQAHRDVFRKWREKHAKATDAYLWFRTLVCETRRNGPEAALAVVRSKRNIYLRVAALDALAQQKADECLELIPELLQALPSDPVGRAMIVESLGACLATQRFRIKDDDFESPARQLIALLDDKKTLRRTRHVLARYLGQLFKTEDRFIEAGPWLNALLFARTGGKEGSDAGYGKTKRPVFAGIEATGDRIVYVMDMSDSMLKPLDHEVLTELRKLPTGPITGGGGAEKAKGNKKKKGPFGNERHVNWKKVKTRFDAAREMLKLSLISLPKDKQFAVILFGDEARLMKATKGLRNATPKQVSKVIRELDSIEAGPSSSRRPDGQLRGQTNLHGGLHRAFKVVAKGLLGPGEYVNPKGFLNGAETIFVLSDGLPTWDDWPATDRADEFDRAGDPETGKPLTKTPNLVFGGPFSRSDFHILNDLQRLNLFRKCEIHGVGLGEASEALLRGLADVGLGKVKMLGKE